MNYTITKLEIGKYEKPINGTIRKDSHLFNVGKNNIALKMTDDFNTEYKYYVHGYNNAGMGIKSAMFSTQSELAMLLADNEIAEDCEIIFV